MTTNFLPCKDLSCDHIQCYDWRNRMRAVCPHCKDTVESKFGRYDKDTEDFRDARWHKVCIEDWKRETREMKAQPFVFGDAA